MNVLFVQPPNSQLISRISLGLLSIGSYLKTYSCHNATVLDLASYLRSGDIVLDENVYLNCAEYIINKYHSDVYAFSTIVTNEIPALQIAKYIKEREPECKICFGNQWASLNDVDIIRNFDFVDVIIRGEGEIVTKQLIDSWSTGMSIENIPGITYRCNGEVRKNADQALLQNLDEIPKYDYDLLSPSYTYYSPSEFGGHYGILEFGRGCPYSCSFCSTTLLWRRKVRRFSVSRTISDINTLINMGFDFIEFTYDNFGTVREEVMELCETIISSQLDIHWSIRCRLDYLDEELISKLKMANCTAILVGVESGSTGVLDKVEKNISCATMFKNIGLLVASGIRVDASFVTGLPYESYEDILNTIKLASLIKSYGKQSAIEIHFVTPLPGTKFTKDAIENNVLAFSSNPTISPDFSKYISWPKLFNDNNLVAMDEYRLPQDQALINTYPTLFTAYGYVYNDEVSSEFFAAVSTYVNVLIQFYPMTIFLLCSMETVYHPSFIEQFQKYSSNHGLPIEDLLKIKIEVEAEIESCCREDTSELLEMFTRFLEENISKDSMIFDFFRFEKSVVELAEDKDFVESCLKNFQIRDVNNDFTIYPKCRVIMLKHDVLNIIKAIQNSWETGNQVNIQEPTDYSNQTSVYYLLLPERENKRYFSGLKIEKITEDIYSIFSKMDGARTVSDIIYLIRKEKENYQFGYKKEIDRFLNVNKNIWYQRL